MCCRDALAHTYLELGQPVPALELWEQVRIMLCWMCSDPCTSETQVTTAIVEKGETIGNDKVST